MKKLDLNTILTNIVEPRKPTKSIPLTRKQRKQLKKITQWNDFLMGKQDKGYIPPSAETIAKIELREKKRKERKAEKIRKLLLKEKKCFTYEEYINSTIWTKKRLKYFERNSYSCRRCGIKRYIHLHHAVYPDPDKYGTEPDEHLFAMCSNCHREFHNKYGTQKNMYENTVEFIENMYI